MEIGREPRALATALCGSPTVVASRFFKTEIASSARASAIVLTIMEVRAPAASLYRKKDCV